jgi:pyruvate dehydrogenase E1 component beta subunit
MSIKTGSGALNEALAECMRKDANVFIFGEDIIHAMFGVTRGLVKEFGPERIFNTPISESALMAAAVGASIQGVRPVLEIQFADILSISFDHIVNSAAKMHYLSDGMVKCPLVVRAPMGYGISLGMHHSQCVESWFANVPGLIIAAPSTPADAKGLLTASVENDNPVIFLEHKKLYFIKGEVPDGYYKVPLGKGDIKREGKDLTIVSYSFALHTAMQAAEELAKQGIEAEVVDPRTIRPLDVDIILQSVRKTGRLVIVHEAPAFGGFGGEIAAIVAEHAFSSLKGPIIRVCGKECPVPFGMETVVVPKAEDIVMAVKQSLAK